MAEDTVVSIDRKQNGRESHLNDESRQKPGRAKRFSTLDSDVRTARARKLTDSVSSSIALDDGSAALILLKNWVADLDEAIYSSDLTNRAEFSALMALMVGLGIPQVLLAEKLGISANTVNRYVTGASDPGSVANRRGMLVETFRILQDSVNDCTLPILSFFPSCIAARN